MNTFLLTLLVSNLVLESACAYLIYKKRHQLKYALQKFLGIESLQNSIGTVQSDLFSETARLNKKLKFIRKAQKKEKADLVKAVDSSLVDFLREGRLIDAIKHYRNIHGTDLKTSKDAIEAMRDRLRSEGVLQ